MIISDSTASSQKRPRYVFLAMLSLSAIALLFLFFKIATNLKSWVDYQTPPLESYVILCDAEKVENDEFITADYKFSNGQTQSKDIAYSGNYSCKLSEGEGYQFGITYRLDKYSAGDLFKISAWRYAPDGGKSGIAIGDNEKFYTENAYTTHKNEDGWEKIEFYINAPSSQKTLSFYVFSKGQTITYFDDLRIEKIVEENQFQAEVFDLQLKDKHLLKIQKKRQEALKAGLLESSDNDWVSAKIIPSDQATSIPVELRLKGDWLDHLRGDKWSFRIKVKDPLAWNRLKTFSVQTPAAREYLNEWLLHKLWHKEDVLTTRYDFIKLSLNGKSKGIYAYEEHFDKQLAESQHRREGPIVRFAEDGFWAALKRQLEHVESDLNYGLPQPEKNKENAVIRPFKEGKTLKSESLTRQFEIAQKLMQQYVSGEYKAEEVFDTDRLAKYFAICDVMGAYHGLVWHNQRFYYNPVTSKLEPVGFDGFPTIPKYQSSFIGNGALNKVFRSKNYLYEPLFLQQDFYIKYIQYLYQFTSRDYLNDFLEEVRPGLEKRFNLFKKEFPFYKFSEENFLKRAQRIHLQILPLPNVSIRAFRQTQVAEKEIIKVSNLHGLPIAIIGTGSKKNQLDNRLKEQLILPGFQNQNIKNRYTNFKLDQNAKFLFYKTLGIDSIFTSEIINWDIEEGFSPRQTLGKTKAIVSNEIFSVSEHVIYFKEGESQTSQDIYLPKGYKVDFAAGAKIDFIKGAKFISESPVQMLGTEEKPIKITSSDGSAGGFSVLQANRQSLLRYVIFDGLNTLNHEGWTLTGAVSFYESDVDISNSIFRNNHCEDGLNIIRSKFSLEKILVSNTPFDGLDIDFGEGRISNSQFTKTGNDGMDFSGCKVYIENCHIEDNGDKGISVGEQTIATVSSASVKNAIIGVAAKDLSELTIQKISLEDCALGFTAYQKKPEFGGSKITVKEYSDVAVKKLFQILPQSELILRGKKFKGK